MTKPQRPTYGPWHPVEHLGAVRPARYITCADGQRKLDLINPQRFPTIGDAAAYCRGANRAMLHSRLVGSRVGPGTILALEAAFIHGATWRAACERGHINLSTLSRTLKRLGLTAR